MNYVDGFLLAVPTANKQKFIDYARKFDTIFMEFGALRIVECWGDDVPPGKQTDFFRSVQATAEETVVFSWIEWPDKATRDPRMDMEANPMPWDGARMIYGGFAPVLVLE